MPLAAGTQTPGSEASALGVTRSLPEPAAAQALAAAQLARLRWRCRRGMRELDFLLSRYLENDYLQADTAQRRAFESLLDLPDPVILDYVLARALPQDFQQEKIVACLTLGLNAATPIDRASSGPADPELSSQ